MKKKFGNRDDEFKKLEEEMVEKGSAVTPTERHDISDSEDFEDLEQAIINRSEHIDDEEPRFITPEEEAAYKRKKKRIVIIVVLVTLIAVLGAGAYFAYRFLGPSKEQADLTKEFELGQDEVALIIDGVVSEKKGRVLDGTTYIPYEIASSYMDDRLYVDTKENILTYVTEDEVTDYNIDEEKDGEKPLTQIDEEYYIALPFIAKTASCEYTEYSDPSRIAIFSDRTKTYTTAVLAQTYIRKGPGDKYSIIMEAKEGTEVFIDETRQEENGFRPVVTSDGFKGYVPNSDIKKSESKAITFSKEPASFTQASLGENVCLGWHNIGSKNYTSMPDNLSEATVVNVLAPTWYILKNNKGGLKSIANQAYVDAAHNAGKKVWPTVRDFPNKSLKLQTVLGKTTTRRKLIKNLLKEAEKYGVDGLNIDFERVKEKAAKAYLEFLRELTVEAHKQNLIISTDNYPIREYNMYYNPSEQGRVVDYVFFMAYDEHYAGSEEAGSVSSLLYVQDAVSKAVARVPKERVVVGLPFFTRLWLETEKEDSIELTSEVLNMGEAENWVWTNGAKSKWDKEVGQNYVELKKGKKKTYRMWLENEKSIKAKLKEVKKEDIAGVGFWAMGQERSITWETIAKTLK